MTQLLVGFPIDIFVLILIDLEPLELLLRSTDNEGVFDCNSRVQLNKQQSKLTASIENLNMTPPMFLLKTEQTNGTTIRIRVKPNGYIGLNRISCHWKNNQTFGHTADLIIGGRRCHKSIRLIIKFYY